MIRLYESCGLFFSKNSSIDALQIFQENLFLRNTSGGCFLAILLFLTLALDLFFCVCFPILERKCSGYDMSRVLLSLLTITLQ